MQRFTRSLFLVLIAGILAACMPTPATETAVPTVPASTESATPGTPEAVSTSPPAIDVPVDALKGLKIHIWHAYLGTAADAFTTLLTKFNATNEWGIAVYQTAYGSYNELQEAVDASLVGDQPPELAVLLPEQALGILEAALVDLNLYVHEPQWGLSETDLVDIPSVFWMQDEVDRFRLGIPAQRTARLMIYNQTWASELGFDAPPLTADEFQKQACAANQSKRLDDDPANDGYGGWIIDSDSYTVLSWFSVFGGGVMDGDTYQFSSDENLAALAYLKSLYDNNCAYLSTEPNPYQSFANRSGLFATVNLSELGWVDETLSRTGNRDKWTVLPFPGEDASLVTFGPSYNLMVTSDAEQLAAWLFVRWLLSAENQAEWARMTGLFPLRMSSLDLMADTRSANLQWAAAVDLIPLAEGVPQLASWVQVRYVLGDGMAYLFRMNTPAENLPTILAEMNMLARELEEK